VENKVLPRELFGNIRGYQVYCVGLFCTGFLVYSINSYFILFAQNVYARPGNYTDVGVLGILQGAGVMTGNLILWFFTHRVGHLKWQICFALGYQALWVALLSLCTPNTKGMAEAFVYLGGIGVSWTIGTCLACVSFCCSHNLIGRATQSANCYRLVGATVGLAAYSAILAEKLAPALTAYIPPAAIAAGLPASSVPAVMTAASVFSATAYNSVPGINPDIIAAVQFAKESAYCSVFKYLWLTGMAIGLAGMLIVPFGREFSKEMDNTISVDLDKVRRRHHQHHVAEK